MSRVGDSDFHETCKSLLGKKVRIKQSDEPEVWQIGVLHSFTDDGEFDLREEAGNMMYGWPLLEIEPA